MIKEYFRVILLLSSSLIINSVVDANNPNHNCSSNATRPRDTAIAISSRLGSRPNASLNSGSDLIFHGSSSSAWSGDMFDSWYSAIQEVDDDFIINGTLKVAAMFSEMEALHSTQLSDGTVVNIYGSANIAYGFILDLQELFNFTIELTESLGWMTPGQNDTITGVGYQIASGGADIGIDISKPVVYRAKHLTFLHAIKQDRVAIMFRQPKIQTFRNILSRPFRNGIWKCALGSWLILLAAAFFTSKLRIGDIQDIFLSITATTLARSVHITSFFHCSNQRSLNVVILVSSLFGFTMYSIYSAFIVSSLKRAEAPVKKFEDLIAFEYELIAQSSLPDFTNVYVNDRKTGNYYAEKARKNFISVEDGLQRLFPDPYQNNTSETEMLTDLDDDDDDEYNPNVAWFALKSDFAYLAMQHGYTARQFCEISRLDPVVRAEHPRLLAMYIGKNNSRMREHFNRRILDILARGLGNRHIRRFENEFEPTCGDLIKKVEIKSIKFYDVYAAYALLIGGAVAAVSIWLVGEIILPFLWKRSNIGIHNDKYRIDVKEVSVAEVNLGVLSKVSCPENGIDDSISIAYID